MFRLVVIFAIPIVLLASCKDNKDQYTMDLSGNSSKDYSTDNSNDTSIDNSTIGTTNNYDKGIVVGTRVNVRKRASTKSKIVGVVYEGDQVSILKRNDKKVKISKYYDRWVKVKTPKGVTGYLYGAFLFDMNKFYSSEGWQLQTCSGAIVKIKFTESKKFYNVGGCAEPGCGKAKLTGTGTYRIQKRRIIFSEKLPGSKTDKLYFYRINRVNFLAPKASKDELKSYKNVDKSPCGFTNYQ